MNLKTILQNVVFLIAFAVLGIAFNFHETSFLEPSGLHLWRQADCLSFTIKYMEGNSFWEPELHNQLAMQSTEGYSVGEFPVVYYVIGKVWSFTGKRIVLYRLFMLGFFFLGLWALFRTFIQLGFHWLVSLPASLLLLASPFFVYYANGFLPNSIAISLVFIAWFFTVRYGRQKRFYFFILACVFFTLGALLKITAAISFIALTGALVLYALFLRKRKVDYLMAFMNRKVWVTLLLSVAAIIGWYMYARYYNDLHQGYFTFNYASPLWEMSNEQIDHVLREIELLWLDQIVAPDLLTFLEISLLISVAFFLKIPLALRLLLPLLVIGIASYGALWFKLLEPHDYYWTDAMILVPFFACSLMYMIRAFRFPIDVFITGIILFYTAYTGINYSIEKVEERFYGWWQSIDEVSRPLTGITNYLDSIGVSPEASVISYPDKSYNSSLYFIRRNGWTEINDLSSADALLDKVNKGADYLVLSKEGGRAIPPYFTIPSQKKIGAYGEVEIYKLSPGFLYDFEVAAGAPQWLVDHRVDSVALTGTYSLGSAGEEFIAETELKSLRPGSRVEVTVWVKTSGKNFSIPVIQSLEGKLAYQQERFIIKNHKGWQLMKQELVITEDIAQKGVKVFLWNPAGVPVNYDDFQARVFTPENGFTLNFEQEKDAPAWTWGKTSDSVAFSGNYALNITPEDAYTGETKLTTLTAGTHVKAQVWVYGINKPEAIPVIQSIEAGLAFKQEWISLEKKGNWHLMQQELILDAAMAQEGIKVFLWNPAHRSILLDDFSVEVIKP